MHFLFSICTILVFFAATTQCNMITDIEQTIPETLSTIWDGIPTTMITIRRKMKSIFGTDLMKLLWANSKHNTTKNRTCTLTDSVPTKNGSLYVYGGDGYLYKVNSSRHSNSSTHAVVRVFYYLYTNPNSTEPEELFLNDEATFINSGFDPKIPTVLVTHGFMSSATGPSCIAIKDAFLSIGNYNVIAVDWSSGADTLQYSSARLRVPIVSSLVASMINFLEDNGLNTTQTTLIGHSLGAHVMGLSGQKCNGIISHVVGLDPAMPGFIGKNNTQRISVLSGDYVEIVHTNAGELGLFKAVGHQDFYPDGGSQQPGCYEDPESACSHSRSYFLYAEAVSTTNPIVGKRCLSYSCFIANECSNVTAIMGKSAGKTIIEGKYYFLTKSEPAYSLGLCGIGITTHCQD